MQVRDGSLPPMKAAFDKMEPVRYECALLPNLDRRLVKVLSADGSVNVRAAIAQRPDLPERIVEDLAWDPNPVVRARIAGRSDLSDRVRDRLREDTDARVLDALGEWDRAALIRRMPCPSDREGEGKHK